MQLPSNNTQILGNEGELLVGQWLIKQGFILLARNFSVAQGEIDIIALQGQVLAFVEVKTRKNPHFALSQVITLSKQRKIVLAAKMYLMRNQFIDKIYRFDVALVTETNGSIEYIENAFQGA